MKIKANVGLLPTNKYAPIVNSTSKYEGLFKSEYYSKEEVETILFNFAENNGLLGSSSDIEYFNEWIKENLK